MFAFLIRSIGLWMVAAAVVSVVIDGMKSIAAGRLILTPMLKTWQQLSPGSLAAAEASLRKIHPVLWDGIIQYVLLVPAWIVLVVLGVALMALGTRRSKSVAYVV